MQLALVHSLAHSPVYSCTMCSMEFLALDLLQYRFLSFFSSLTCGFSPCAPITFSFFYALSFSPRSNRASVRSFIHSFHHSFASLVWLPIALYLSFNCSLSLCVFMCFSASFPITPCPSSLHQIQLPIQMVCLVILFVLFCCHHCAAISFVCNFSLIGRLVPNPRIEPYSKSSSMSFDFCS